MPRILKKYPPFIKGRFRGGLIPDPEDKKDFVYSAPIRWLFNPPPKSDLRETLSPTTDQIDTNTCVAHGVQAVVKQLHNTVYQDSYTPSILFPYYLSLVASGDIATIDGVTYGIDNGTSIRSVLKVYQKIGDCTEERWPFQKERVLQVPTQECVMEAAHHKILSYHRVSRLYNFFNSIKASLADGNPIIGGFALTLTFPCVLGVKDIPMPRGPILGYHCMDIVGHDDETERFLVRNSWSNLWGNNGYGYMPYSYLKTKYVSDFWVINKN